MSERIATPPKPAQRLRDFVRFLKAEDYGLSMTETLLLAKGMNSIEEPDAEQSCNIMRAICCRSEDEWRRFDKLFRRFWFPKATVEPPAGDPVRALFQASTGGSTGLGGNIDNPDAYSEDETVSGGAARQTTISRADFRFLSNRSAMRKAAQLAEALARRIPHKSSRRQTINKSSGTLALRPTLRASTRYGGVPLGRFFTRARREPINLVILHDVSHSMTFNNPLLFRFCRGLVRHSKDIDAYIFHTKLFRVTPVYRESSLQRMRDLLEARNHLWLGGTCIAESIATFLREHARSALRSKSIVMVISDGCDSNSPEDLAVQLQTLRDRCHRLYWLNPMLEREGVDPHSPAMENVRGNVDKLLAAHSVDSLRRVIESL